MKSRTRKSLLGISFSIVIGVILAAPPRRATAANETFLNDAWLPDGPVHTLLITNNTLYIGGDFRTLGPMVPGMALLDTSTKKSLVKFPQWSSSSINLSAPDGKGGWFLSGYFQTADNVWSSRIVHLRFDGSEDPNFHPVISGGVYTMSSAGGRLYVGGYIQSVDGQPRTHLASFDIETGTLTSWAPAPNSFVYALAARQTNVFVSGNFVKIKSDVRRYLASLDSRTGDPLPFNVPLGAGARSLLVDGDRLYVNGVYGTVGTSNRYGMAAIEISTGKVEAWNPLASGGNSWVISGTNLYVAGDFTGLGSKQRFGVGAISTITGEVTGWNPNTNFPPGSVNLSFSSIGISGNTVYVAGTFTNFGNSSVFCRNLIAVDATTGAALTSAPAINGPVTTLIVSSNTLFVAGAFKSVGSINRTNLAAISLATGKPTSWQPKIDVGHYNKLGPIKSLAFAGSKLLIGGAYSLVTGVRHGLIAWLDLQAGDSPEALTLPMSAGDVTSVTAIGDTAYAAGTFTTIAYEPRDFLAAFSLSSGILLPWAPPGFEQVRTLASDGTNIYVGGSFLSVGDEIVGSLASVDAVSGDLRSWRPYTDGTIRTIVIQGPTMYVGGAFTSAGLRDRSSLAALGLVSGKPLPWAPRVDGNVNIIAPTDSAIYLGGNFHQIGSFPRSYLAAINPVDGSLLDWAPAPDNEVYSLAAGNGYVVFGGKFQTVADGRSQNLAIYRQQTVPVIIANSLRLKSNGKIEFQIQTPSNQSAIIQASPDLLTWTSLATNGPGLTLFSEPSGPTLPTRFFRLGVSPH